MKPWAWQQTKSCQDKTESRATTPEVIVSNYRTFTYISINRKKPTLVGVSVSLSNNAVTQPKQEIKPKTRYIKQLPLSFDVIEREIFCYMVLFFCCFLKSCRHGNVVGNHSIQCTNHPSNQPVIEKWVTKFNWLLLIVSRFTLYVGLHCAVCIVWMMIQESEPFHAVFNDLCTARSTHWNIYAAGWSRLTSLERTTLFSTDGRTRSTDLEEGNEWKYFDCHLENVFCCYYVFSLLLGFMVTVLWVITR